MYTLHVHRYVMRLTTENHEQAWKRKWIMRERERERERKRKKEKEREYSANSDHSAEVFLPRKGKTIDSSLDSSARQLANVSRAVIDEAHTWRIAKYRKIPKHA